MWDRLRSGSRECPGGACPGRKRNEAAPWSLPPPNPPPARRVRAPALVILVLLPLVAVRSLAAGLPPPAWTVALYSADSRGVGLLWKPVPGAEAYRVLRGEGDAGGELRPLVLVKGLHHVDGDVVPGETYVYRLQAVGGGGVSPPSEARSVGVPPPFAVLAAPPPAWRGVRVEEVEDETGGRHYRVDLRWRAFGGSIGCNLYRQADRNGAHDLLGLFTGGRHVDESVEPGRTYRYTLTAVRGDLSESGRSLPADAVVSGSSARKIVVRRAKGLIPATVLWQVRNQTDPLVTRERQARLEDPFDVAYDARRDLLHVSSVGNRHVATLRGGDGSLVRYVGPTVQGGELRVPLGVGLDRDGNLHVVDQGVSAVLVFSPEGKLLRRIAVARRKGGAPPRLIDVAVSGKGEVFVTDNANAQVVVFDVRGREISRWGTRGWRAGELQGVSSIAVTDDGGVAVGDGWTGRVSVFRRDGRFLAVLAGGTSAGEGITYLSGFAPLGGGVLLAADLFDHTLKAISSTVGRPYLGTLGGETGRERLPLLGPLGVAGDGGDRIFVSEGISGRVTCLKLEGPLTGAGD